MPSPVAKTPSDAGPFIPRTDRAAPRGSEDGRPFSTGFPAERPAWIDLLLVLVAVTPLFFGLGRAQLWGSEARWLFIAQSMRETGDWLEPDLHGEWYGDKPLLSYWTIVLASLPFGRIDEGVARIPSALSGAAAALLAAWLAARLLGRRAAAPAGWILATTLYFIFWSRTAAADTLNVSFTLAAVAIYVEWSIRPRSWKIFLFFAILALGGNAKGMPAVIIPIAIAGADIALFRRGPAIRHAGWIAAGLFAGVALYLTPFLLSYLDHGDWHLLSLMWKENFVRAFAPFDHRGSIFTYASSLPGMMLPWSLWLPGAIGWASKRFRASAAVRTRDERVPRGFRFLLIAFILTFLAFTASRSRRHYYILPILPFCAILTAGFLCEFAARRREGDPLARFWRILAFYPLVVLGALLPPAIAFALAGRYMGGMPGEVARFLPYSTAIGLGFVPCAGVLILAWRRRSVTLGFTAFAAVASIMAVYTTTGVDMVRDRLQTERPFAQEIGRRYPAEEKVYFRVSRRLTWYLPPGIEAVSVADVEASIDEKRGEVLVVCEPKFLPFLQEAKDLVFTELMRAVPPAMGPFVKVEPKHFLVRCARRSSADPNASH